MKTERKKKKRKRILSESNGAKRTDFNAALIAGNSLSPFESPIGGKNTRN